MQTKEWPCFFGKSEGLDVIWNDWGRKDSICLIFCLVQPVLVAAAWGCKHNSPPLYSPSHEMLPVLSSGRKVPVHCKKRLPVLPSPVGRSLTKLYLGGKNDVMYKLFPPRESLIGDIPAGDGNSEKLFYGV
jgi:hypothetical protein